MAAQSLGNAGTIEGTVKDPSGAVVAGADVSVKNAISGYAQSVKSGADGAFKFGNIPPNTYHMQITAPGFATFTKDVPIRSAIPVQVNATLQVSGSVTEVNVEASGADMVETDPSAHVDVDRSAFLKLPTVDPGAGLSSAITYSTGGVTADSNGSFHPLGDHAQVAFVLDGQPITDQQSKVFSTQLPTSAIQSMELNTGTPNAEFGDKTSLVAQITTRSGLGALKPFGSVDASYGSFGTTGGSVAFGFGREKIGNFVAIDGTRSSRFLDSPEFQAFHDKGNNETIFDRFDYQPSGKDVFHLNLFVARNWIQIPNSYGQLSQDQKQRVMTWSVAPGYQHTFNARTLFTINMYARKDQFIYYGSRNPFADTPFTDAQDRHLLNYGVRSDISVVLGHHNVKAGIDFKQTRLFEKFSFGVTDPAFTVDNPGLRPYDLTQGGQPFSFRGKVNINQYAAYVQDAITIGSWQINVGIRGDQYNGIVADGAAQPRAGLAYNFKRTNTVLRASYSRTFETPFNENLILSNATGSGGLAQNVFGAAQSSPIRPGRRNQFNTGFQQGLSKYLLLDVDVFWKYTHGAFDFNSLLNTTITFPISWHNSKLDGFTGRLSSINLHGFQAYWTFGHTRARYFPPENGGLIPQASLTQGVFRIDHDQAFQSTVDLRYQRPHNAEWISFTWRYDSGLVVSGVPDVEAALMLTAAQQTTIGFSCNGTFSTFAKPIDSCNGSGKSTLLTLPQTGKENDDHNPDRVKPRGTFNVGLGTDNLLHADGPRRVTASLTIANLTNKEALYNFLSTFSGTHFLQPRTAVAHIGYAF